MAKKRFSRIYVEITNVCNRSCSFCPGTARAPRMLSVDEFSIIAEKISPLTDYVYLHVMGEPLMHPELFDIISIAKLGGLNVAITTNGTLLGELSEELICAKPYKVNVSIHSFEEGSTEEYLEYINSVFNFADKASDAGILVTLRLWNKGYDEGRNINTLELMKARFPGEWALGVRGARIKHKLHLEEGERFSWPDMRAELLGDRVFCHGLGDHVAILSDGSIVPCCLDREGAITLGNIFSDDPCQVLSSPRAEAIRSGFKNKCATEELCKRCGYARRFKI
ncbi:MAG: radical SAM protein [Clostridia bacterium]|nr:radical SAM protein [Clostridia bacterium]